MWIKHQLGPATLPQKCARCGVVLIEDKINPDTGAQVAEPMDPQPIFSNSEEGGAIAVAIPAGTPFQECSKS
jgi:hypothetical protein